MKRPDDMPYDVYKAMRSDINKKLKERKRGDIIFVSQEIKESTDKSGKKFNFNRFPKGRTAKKKT